MKFFKKPRIIALVGLAALIVVGSVWAYWSQTSTIENPFDTGSYGSTVREEFKPSEGEDWQPGVKVNKTVTAVNTGDTDLIVRARLDEVWARKATPTVPFKDSKAATGGYDVYTTNQAIPNATNPKPDGLTAADGSVVTKTLSSSANWVKGNDGWYYYKANLPGGQTTDAWLDSVTLLADADMGAFETKKYVSVTPSTTPEANWVWVEYTGAMPKYIGTDEVLRNKTETTYAKAGGVELLGYSKSDYTLTVTVQTVQPTSDAVNAVFGGGSTFTAPTGTAWTLK